MYVLQISIDEKNQVSIQNQGKVDKHILMGVLHNLLHELCHLSGDVEHEEEEGAKDVAAG